MLAFSSADAATVGASAIELRKHLHIDNTDIGLLVGVSSLVGAVAALPFGSPGRPGQPDLDTGGGGRLLGRGHAVERHRRFLRQASAHPAGTGLRHRPRPAHCGIARRRLLPEPGAGRIYSFILTGELIGAGLGFAVTGDIAALSWRLAFVILAIPAFLLAYLLFRLPEPLRGGQGALLADPAYPAAVPEDAAPETAAGHHDRRPTAGPEQHVAPDPRLLARGPSREWVSWPRHATCCTSDQRRPDHFGACGYYFLAGVQTFGVEFVHAQYHVNQVLANLLMLLVGGGAAAGVIVAGPLSDRLLRNGHLKGRIQVPAFAAVATVVLFIPALVTHSSLTALPYIFFAASALSAQNPPIDAARLDIVPAGAVGPGRGHPHLRPLGCPGVGAAVVRRPSRTC